MWWRGWCRKQRLPVVVVNAAADIFGGFGLKIWRQRRIAQKSQSIRDCSEFARFCDLTRAVAVHSALTAHSSRNPRFVPAAKAASGARTNRDGTPPTDDRSVSGIERMPLRTTADHLCGDRAAVHPIGGRMAVPHGLSTASEPRVVETSPDRKLYSFERSMRCLMLEAAFVAQLSLNVWAPRRRWAIAIAAPAGRGPAGL